MIIYNDKLKKILEERGELFKEIGKINEQMVKLDTERKKLGYKMDKLKDKTLKHIEAEKITLQEFEYIADIGIKDGKIEATIKDQVEDYKQLIREKRLEDAKK